MFSIRRCVSVFRNRLSISQVRNNSMFYTKTHETITLIDHNVIKIGISNYAKEKMGDIVYIDIEDIDESYKTGDALCIIESVKAVSEINSLYDGTIIEHNTKLVDNIDDLDAIDESISSWILKYKINEKNVDISGSLMNSIEYKKYIGDIDK